MDIITMDDFVKRPMSALRFISLSLRRTVSTPRATRFARLDLDLFTKSSKRMTFYEFITINELKGLGSRLERALMGWQW
jgi:hypothetical protein